MADLEWVCYKSQFGRVSFKFLSSHHAMDAVCHHLTLGQNRKPKWASSLSLAYLCDYSFSNKNNGPIHSSRILFFGLQRFLVPAWVAGDI